MVNYGSEAKPHSLFFLQQHIQISLFVAAGGLLFSSIDGGAT